MNNFIKIWTVIFLLAFSNSLQGQVGLSVKEREVLSQRKSFLQKKQETPVLFFSKKNQNTVPKDLRNYFLTDAKTPNPSNSIFQKNNTNTELAFFCRIEVGLEKSSNLPVRFRLGEVQAVDEKEGKWKQFQ